MKISEITIHNFRSIKEQSFKLYDYSMLIGPNNSGKSNVIDAIRLFYNKTKFDEGKDLPKLKTTDDKVWIEIVYSLKNGEYKSLKEEYRAGDNKLKVRNYLKKPKNPGIYIYNGKEEDFKPYGKANKEKILGHVRYIPAVSRVDDHTKFSGKSELRDLIDDVLNKVIKDTNIKGITEQFNILTKSIEGEETTEGRSLSNFQKDINNEINDWGTTFSLKINAPDTQTILKNLVAYDLNEGTSGDTEKEKTDGFKAEQLGSGFQRHFIYSLINISSRYRSSKTAKKREDTKTDTKDFTSEMTLILFEEPEVFLHPPQQYNLSRSLKKIAESEDQQVLLSSHSPHFVSKNADDLKSIIKLNRQKNKETKISQLDSIDAISERLDPVVESEKDNDKEEKDIMLATRYFLWLDPAKSGMFFANKVVLVEGQTEVALFNYILDNEEMENYNNKGVFILDCFGKACIPYFMILLKHFKIPHSVLHDKDENKNPNHRKWNCAIRKSENNCTKKIIWFEKDLETELGIGQVENGRDKPRIVLYKWKETDEIELCKKKNIMKKLKNLIGS